MADGRGRDDGAGLIALVTQLYKAFIKRSTEEILGMRLKEFMVLSHLAERRGTTQQELGEAMFLDPNTVVLILNGLEERGFSVRKRDSEDRRRHVVEVTPEGRRAVERAEKARDAIENEILAGLAESDRQALRGLLLKALEHLAKTPTAARA
ncbi:MAG TPA: MarR family transcriptional regulator [Candidatus Dormibacteraeota bacterium]